MKTACKDIFIVHEHQMAIFVWEIKCHSFQVLSCDMEMSSDLIEPKSSILKGQYQCQPKKEKEEGRSWNLVYKFLEDLLDR